MMSKLKLFLAAVMILMMMVTVASAAVTAPYSLQEEPAASTHSNGKVDPFPYRRSYHGITASERWIMQAKIEGVLIRLQLFERSGQGIAFQENLSKASEGDGIRLTLRQANRMGGVLLQMDQHALDVLQNVGITEIAVVDYDLYLQTVYSVEVLDRVRNMLELAPAEELSVSGLEDPISVVDENGVRRIISE